MKSKIRAQELEAKEINKTIKTKSFLKFMDKDFTHGSGWVTQPAFIRCVRNDKYDTKDGMYYEDELDAILWAYMRFTNKNITHLVKMSCYA